MACWRRLAAWNEAGVWDQLRGLLLKKPRSAKKLDWSRAVIDSSRARAARRGPKAVPAWSIAYGRPRRRPHALFADHGYDPDKYRRLSEASHAAPGWASSRMSASERSSQRATR